MSPKPPKFMPHPRQKSPFTFANRRFDYRRGRATFYYRGPSGRQFVEKVDFDYPAPLPKTRQAIMERALDLAFFLIGTSYYKVDPTVAIKTKRPISPKLADLLNHVYQDGLSQYAYENHLSRGDLAHFRPTDPAHATLNAAPTATQPVPYWRPLAYDGLGIIALQSGGKDSLLVATELAQAKKPFRPVYVSSAGLSHPAVLDQLGKPLTIIRRQLDRHSLKKAHGLDGHIPITYIIHSLALIQAIIYGYNSIAAGIGDEGIEPHAIIPGGTYPETAPSHLAGRPYTPLEVRHQWSKTQSAEDLLDDFIKTEISPTLEIRSPLRGRRELDIAADFATKCWSKYSHSFSSCNRANYLQGQSNHTLHWCGHCPKCANAFLLFAPYVPASELIAVIGGGRNLFTDPSLAETFKGLLGIDGVMKPFECIGETSELREAYARRDPALGPLSFAVPPTTESGV